MQEWRTKKPLRLPWSPVMMGKPLWTRVNSQHSATYNICSQVLKGISSLENSATWAPGTSTPQKQWINNNYTTTNNNKWLLLLLFAKCLLYTKHAKDSIIKPQHNPASLFLPKYKFIYLFIHLFAQQRSLSTCHMSGEGIKAQSS